MQRSKPRKPLPLGHGSLRKKRKILERETKKMAFLFPKISSSPLLPHPNPSQNTPSRLLLSSSSLTKLESPPVRDAPREKHPALHGKSPAALQETKKKNEKRNRNKDDFYLNLGLAVRTLRDDLPSLFSKDLNYDIYRDDITFVDPLSTFRGIENYKLIFWALRFHGRILFREIGLEIFRVWQPSENMILIRWELQGVPRVPWQARGRFQGTSRYRLDRNGKIYEHKVDNLAFNFPQAVVGPATVMDLVAPACPPSPNLTFWGVAMEGSGVLGSCSWLELYRAVRGTLEQEEQVLVGIGMENLVTCS
ncbi:uncharacterized protein LOC103721078 [Phoenix dactylifera]|uniref:Uncharacterized protein LOC103721078 n=1 Tax=Phoenix dactylifera TaxID=42345 RepID=A0A8B7CYU7_PHODC|nr:uncharacterized protein LOC103721078 [Phoenix dactylifera]